MSCPNSAASGCRCPDHHPGLSEYAPDPIAYEAMLAPLRDPVVLTLVTMPGETPCDGSMLCRCQDCLRHNAAREAIKVLQPWVPRPSRRAA